MKYVIQMPSGRYYAGVRFLRLYDCDVNTFADSIEEAYKVDDYSHLEFIIDNWPHIFGGSTIISV